MTIDARGRVRASGGPELTERLEHLDRMRASSAPPRDERLAPPDAGTAIDVDVAIVGGGLSLLVAPVLASHGLRVAVFERARAGVAHREWNASGPELRALVDGGILDAEELERIVVARYRSGICRFHGGGSWPVTGVLDHAVDAGALLEHVRALAVARGVVVHDDSTLEAHGEGRDAIAARFRHGNGGVSNVVARLLVDARGASSPYATADLVCPTVGGVMRGLAPGDAADEIDPSTGDILATIDDADDHGRQHVWEAFPGRDAQATVYLFHYARAGFGGGLLDLYARFFDELPRYKRGDATLLRPTFGFIPGWSRLTPAPRAPGRRMVLVGDAAARHSPLTMCGFGAMLRSFAPAAHAIADAVHRPRALDALQGRVAHDASIHAVAGALAAVMASGGLRGGTLNALLDAAFASLHEAGDATYGALLRDEMTPRAFVSFLRGTATRAPSVYRDVLRSLGPSAITRWGARVAYGAIAG